MMTVADATFAFEGGKQEAVWPRAGVIVESISTHSQAGV
jgi:hypothetical protein